MTEKNHGAYRIHLCGRNDVGELKTFIDQYWSTGHILSQHQGLLDWLYYDTNRNQYNFALARLNETDEIIGIQGFIPSSHFDPDLSQDSVTWFTIVKARDDVKPSGFGLQLMNYVAEYGSPTATGSVGINADVAQIYRRFGYTVDTLNHYFILNDSLSDFFLVDNFDGQYQSRTKASTDADLRRVTGGIAELERGLDRNRFDDTIPTRSIRYIQNRYIEHPFFEYQIYGIAYEGDYSGILALRPVSYEGSQALRWVEYFGDPDALQGIGPQLQSILRDGGYEYIDIYSSGISTDFFEAASMRHRCENMDIVIPDYYSPFEQKNVDIRYAFKSPDDADPVVFNGHGDMDRPNDLDEVK